ncbi:MAG TPA: S49 family peptidase [Phycisphaerales bacterium]|nr:S49 family peptidase [Phycisphaerales bacterium]
MRLSRALAAPVVLSVVCGLALSSGGAVGELAEGAALAAGQPGKKREAKKAQKPAGPAVGVALIEVHGNLTEQPHPLAWLFGAGDHPTLRDTVNLILDAGDDDSVGSIVLRVRDSQLHLTQAEEIGAAIAKVRKHEGSPKKVFLFCDDYSTTETVLGSYCDEALIQAGGGVSVPGMYMEEMYLADTMNWAGLTPQMVQIGDYKGANEQYMHTGPSPQWEQNISGLLDGLYGNVREHIKSGRKMDDAKLDEAMKQSWMALAETGTRVGLLDAAVDLLDISMHLERTLNASALEWTDYTPEDKALAIDTSNPFAMMGKLMKRPDTVPSRESLAIVYITGPIVDGESKEGGFMGEATVGSYTVRRALSEIEDQDLIKGVVVRIDSPGGSAIASEVIWQGLDRLQAKKPVWISVGGMAASGGYYCLSGGQRVYVNPSSIVGSIGVVGGKVAMSGLYDKLKIRIHGRERGPMGRMLGASTPWTAVEEGLVRAKMQETYDLFTKRVSGARKGIDLSKTAEGRLFTGNEAIKNRMADKIGGLDDCVGDLAAELKLTPGEYEILEYPGPKALGEVIGDALGGFMGAPSMTGKIAEEAGPRALFGTVKELVGAREWPQLRDQLSAFMQLRSERVILTSPRAVIVR